MARIARTVAAHLHRVVVIDDDDDLRRSIVRLVARDGHEVRDAATIAEGIELVRSWQPDLVLLDYLLEHGTGADVVRAIRQFDKMAQVLLVTGLATEHPARQLLAELDINGYHDKGDGTQRLLVLIDAALKQYRALRSADRQRTYLRHVIEAMPGVLLATAAPELLRVTLDRLGRLIDVTAGVISTQHSCLFVLEESPGAAIGLLAATGRFQGATAPDELAPEIAAAALAATQLAQPGALEGGLVAIPLATRAGARGALLIVAAGLPDEAIEACEVFGRQVVLAYEHLILLDRSTIDPLTALFNRSFGLDRLEQILRLDDRAGGASSVILLDLDHFKRINDTYGHAAGDRVLQEVAQVIKATCRLSDVVARYGGEEILIALPATGAKGAVHLAERLRQAVHDLAIPFERHTLRVTASLGVACATARCQAAALLALADRELYRAKHAGRDRVSIAGEDDADPVARGG